LLGQLPHGGGIKAVGFKQARSLLQYLVAAVGAGS